MMRVEGSDGRQSDDEFRWAGSILQEAQDRLGIAIAADSVERERAYDDLRHLDGQQWPHHIKAQREAQQRPCLTLNRLPQFVDQVIGDARQNRPSIRVKPAPVSQVNRPQRIPSIEPGGRTKEYTYAEVMEGIIRDIESRSHAEAAYDTGLEHAASVGWGNWRILTEEVDDDVYGDQEIRIQRILNPFSVYWDPSAIEPCKEDAEWCLVTEMVPQARFEREYPDALSSGGSGDIAIGLGDSYNQWFTDEGTRVAEYFRRVPTERVLMKMNDGTTLEWDDDFEQIADELEFHGVVPVDARRVRSWKVEWFKLTGFEILDQGTWAGKHIPVVFCPGKEIYIDGRLIHRGVIRHGKDAQQQFNYWMTAETERIALAPKAPYVAGASQVGPYENIWRTANTDNHAFLPYDDQRNPNPPRREQPPQMSTGEHNLVMMAAENLKATIGLYDASLGNRSNETSGRAILARQREGDTNTFPYIDNLARAVRRTGEILVDLIPRIYDTERIVRILGVDGREDFVQINYTVLDEQTGEEVRVHDLSQARYSVTVSVGPSYASQRMEAADSMAQFLQAVNDPSAAIAVGHIIARNMDWPGHDDMADALRRVAVRMGLAEPDESEQPTQQDIAQQQAQQVQQQIEQGKSQAEMAKAQSAMAQAEASKIDAQAKVMTAQSKMGQVGAPPKPETTEPQMDARFMRGMIRETFAEVLAELAQAQRGRAA